MIFFILTRFLNIFYVYHWFFFKKKLTLLPVPWILARHTNSNALCMVARQSRWRGTGPDRLGRHCHTVDLGATVPRPIPRHGKPKYQPKRGLLFPLCFLSLQPVAPSLAYPSPVVPPSCVAPLPLSIFCRWHPYSPGWPAAPLHLQSAAPSIFDRPQRRVP